MEAIPEIEDFIDQAIVNGDYTIPEYIPLDLLCQEIVNTMLSLKAVENETNIRDIENLKILPYIFLIIELYDIKVLTKTMDYCIMQTVQ